MSARPPLTGEQAFRSARVIAIALLVSGASVAIVGAIVTMPDADVATTREGASLYFWMWVAVAVGTTAAWWVLWRGAADRADTGGVLSRLIPAYALLEGQLMMAFAASIIGRTPMLLVPSITLFALGILLSFPRREWFVPRGR